MAWSATLPEGNEAEKVKYDIVKYTRGKVLDLGCGPWKGFPHWIGVDALHEWRGMGHRPDVIADCTDLFMFASGSMDAVFSSHLLEHIDNAGAALAEWMRVIKPNGHLVLYLPHKNFYPNMGQPGSNPAHKHDFVPADIRALMQARAPGWELIVDEERGEDDEYSFLQVYKKLEDGKTCMVNLPQRAEKTCLVVRYGGIGDHIMAASILPELQNLGYHVTYNTNPQGFDVMQHDPHIDDFYVQDKDQVPNEDLPNFWARLFRNYDHVVNLCESIEGNFLPPPGRSSFVWPNHVRQKYLGGVNYVEAAHDIACVRFVKNRQWFYETHEEETWAKRERKRMCGDNPLVMWVLSGSSHHKATPYSDYVIQALLDANPAVHVLLSGDKECKALEAGWEKNPRVHCRSGEWTIRQSLAFACLEASVVVGPETGILNGVAMRDVPKVIFMTHSSDTNLIRDWVNTVSLRADIKCCPCHRLYYGYSPACPNFEDTGASECMVKLPAQTIFDGIRMALNAEKKEAV